MPRKGCYDQNARLLLLDILLEMQQSSKGRHAKRLLGDRDLTISDLNSCNPVRRARMRERGARDQLASSAEIREPFAAAVRHERRHRAEAELSEAPRGNKGISAKLIRLIEHS